MYRYHFSTNSSRTPSYDTPFIESTAAAAPYGQYVLASSDTQPVNANRQQLCVWVLLVRSSSWLGTPVPTTTIRRPVAGSDYTPAHRPATDARQTLRKVCLASDQTKYSID
jgi:hypothetical protein